MDLLAPLAGTVLYVSYPWNSKQFIILHNLFLQLFSTWTFVSLSHALLTKEFRIESQYYMNDPWINQVVFYFYLSKYYEYLDTFILYSKGKTPIFLQKYHHIGAAIVWHLGWRFKVDSMVFGSLINGFIHSLMYLYYFLTTLNIRVPLIKPYISYLQLTQFVVGTIIGFIWFPYETYENKIITIITLLYVAGNFVLFVKFVQDNYQTKTARLE
jgi:hypothetical protein